MPDIRFTAVANVDPERAARLSAALGTRSPIDWRAVIEADDVDAVVIATPPATHAEIAFAALGAGRHVFCEKPLATEEEEAADIAAAVTTSGRALVVDHVLRYNPILRALGSLRGRLLGPVRRLAFENDASDEDLNPGHWFWDERISGGIFVEHGVHLFDAAHALIGSPPDAVQAMVGKRPDTDLIDLAVATTRHPGGVLATFAHGFSHARRCERQLMRIDFGVAEARISGWMRPYHVKESVGTAGGFLLAAVHRVGLATLTRTPSPTRFPNTILDRPAEERGFLLIPVGYPANTRPCTTSAASRSTRYSSGSDHAHRHRRHRLAGKRESLPSEGAGR